MPKTKAKRKQNTVSSASETPSMDWSIISNPNSTCHASNSGSIFSEKTLTDNRSNDSSGNVSDEGQYPPAHSYCAFMKEFNKPPPASQVEEENPITVLDKLSDAVELLSEKRLDTRVGALKNISSILRTNYLDIDDDWNYLDTTLTNLENILRRGKQQDQTLAAECLTLLCTQLSPSELSLLVPRFLGLLEPVIRDDSSACCYRSACATGLSFMLFFATFDDFETIKNVMTALESSFKGSCLKGDGKSPTHPAEVSSFHERALRAWTLLYSLLPISEAESLGKDIIGSLVSLLQSVSVNIRIAAGESLSVVYERVRFEIGEKFRGPHFGQLKNLLNTLASDGAKNKSKTDRKKQRQFFRDIENFVIYHESIENVIKLGTERLLLTSCGDHFYYSILCHVLAGGVYIHLLENELIRSLFGLGPAIVKSATSQVEKQRDKDSRRYANHFSFKMRTYYLTGQRDRKNVVYDSE